MKRRFSGGNEERENRYWIEGEEKSSECAMRRERQLRTCGMDVAKWEKGTGRNTEWGRKGDEWKREKERERGGKE
jgi:hypothetical protein